jgi:hypothetical protein
MRAFGYGISLIVEAVRERMDGKSAATPTRPIPFPICR